MDNYQKCLIDQNNRYVIIVEKIVLNALYITYYWHSLVKNDGKYLAKQKRELQIFGALLLINTLAAIIVQVIEDSHPDYSQDSNTFFILEQIKGVSNNLVFKIIQLCFLLWLFNLRAIEI